VRAGLAPDFSVPPIDRLDAAYRKHDLAYFKTKTDPYLTRFDRFARTVQADLILIGSIDCLRQIERPSLSFGALMYAALTQVVFAPKITAYRWGLIMTANLGKAIAAVINSGMNHLASMNPRCCVRTRRSTSYGNTRLPPCRRQRADWFTAALRSCLRQVGRRPTGEIRRRREDDCDHRWRRHHHGSRLAGTVHHTRRLPLAQRVAAGVHEALRSS
jgi:hypothetical protein